MSRDRDIIQKLLIDNNTTIQYLLNRTNIEDSEECYNLAMNQQASNLTTIESLTSKLAEKEEPKYSIRESIYENLTHNTEWTNVLPDDIASNEGLMIMVVELISKQLDKSLSGLHPNWFKESEVIDLGGRYSINNETGMVENGSYQILVTSISPDSSLQKRLEGEERLAEAICKALNNIQNIKD